MKKMILHLAGSMYCEGQAFFKSIMARGQELQQEKLYMVRDPQNPKDANAVQVWYDDKGNKVRLGFVNRYQAPEVAEYFDGGGYEYIINAKIYGSSDTNYGLFFTVQLIFPYDYEPPDYDIPEDYWYDDCRYSFNSRVDTPLCKREISKVGVRF